MNVVGHGFGVGAKIVAHGEAYIKVTSGIVKNVTWILQAAVGWEAPFKTPVPTINVSGGLIGEVNGTAHFN